MAAISHVFTIGHVAALLGEDEEWLFDLSIDMFPEDGCLHVYGVGDLLVGCFLHFRGAEALRHLVLLVAPLPGHDDRHRSVLARDQPDLAVRGRTAEVCEGLG